MLRKFLRFGPVGTFRRVGPIIAANSAAGFALFKTHEAGRALGRQQFLDQALDLFQRSLDQDPNAVNARLSLAISLHVAQRYEEEIPHLEHLMTALPSDPQVLRLAIQAGKWGGNDALADKAFALLVEHHPQLKPVAERFMKQPPPPRRGVPK